MPRSLLRTALGTAGFWAALGVGCQELPKTAPPVRGGSAGIVEGAGGSAGVGGSTGGSTGGGTTAGSGGSGAGAGTGGSPPTAGTSASGGSGATGGSGAEGGAPEPGSGGTSTAGGGSAGSGTLTGGNGGRGGSTGSAAAGGSSGSGGSVGGGGTFSTDPNDFYGDPRCSDELDFCEDFESGSLDTDRWELFNSGIGAEVDDTQAARGSYAAHFRSDENGFSTIHTAEPFPATNNTYWGRMFVYIDELPTAPAAARWTLAWVQEEGEDYEVRIGGELSGSSNLLGVGSNFGPTGDWMQLDDDGGPAPVPEGEWFCVEWLHDGENHEGRVFWDGVEHPSLRTTETVHGGSDDPYELPPIERIWFGWWLYQPDPMPTSFDVWIDEIALDDERIGCEN